MALLSRYVLPGFFEDEFYRLTRPFLSSSYFTHSRVHYRNISDDKTNLEIELAGYRKDQIEVYVEDGYLVVSAKDDKSGSSRSYKNCWIIDEKAKVDKVHYDNGLLVVEMSKVIPPKPPRTTFEIT